MYSAKPGLPRPSRQKQIPSRKMKQYIAAGASIFLASCSQSDSDREAFKLGGSKEERRERNTKREERLSDRVLQGRADRSVEEEITTAHALLTAMSHPKAGSGFLCC